jgi:hypothetical protein
MAHMDTTELRSKAYNILSDTRQLKSKTVSMQKICSHEGIKVIDSKNYDLEDYNTLGRVSYTGKIFQIVVNNTLSPAEQRVEEAVLYAYVKLNGHTLVDRWAKETLPNGRVWAARHKRDSEEWERYTLFAQYILLGSFIGKERKIVQDKNALKNIHKYAHQKKVSTEFLVQYLTREAAKKVS